MTRVVISVATTTYYQRGQDRLGAALKELGETGRFWRFIPPDWPQHKKVPYAFKAYALKEASEHADLLLWCDACMIPVRPLGPLWERIERDGYWMGKDGWNNYEWTADSGYPDLFPEFQRSSNYDGDSARAQNRAIPHVCATAFGLNLKHAKGKAFLEEYYRLASQTKAFCGPWRNANHPNHAAVVGDWGGRMLPCGPPDVRGHRHDQTAASVIAWRLGFELTEPPNVMTWGDPEEAVEEETFLIAHGDYA